MDIFKYELRTGGIITTFTWSKESQILCFKYVNGIPTIWVKHSEDYILNKDYDFIVIPTGSTVLYEEEEYNYVGTDIADGWYVGHCFYRTF